MKAYRNHIFILYFEKGFPFLYLFIQIKTHEMFFKNVCKLDYIKAIKFHDGGNRNELLFA